MDVLIQVMIRERVRVRPLPVELLLGQLDRRNSGGAFILLRLSLGLAVLLALLALGRRRRHD